MLGGYDVAISAFSKNPEGAAAFAEFLTSADWQKTHDGGFAAVDADGHLRRPGGAEAFPFAEKLKHGGRAGAAATGLARLPAGIEAIFKNVHAALQGKMPPEEAAKKMTSEIEKALQTF